MVSEEFVTAAGNPAGVIQVGGKSYMTDARGALVPLDLVKPADKLEDEVVRKIFGYAEPLSAEIARFKEHTFEDVKGFQALLSQEYDAKAGGAKGNVTLMTFDGLLKVQVAIADVLDFGPQIQDAKTLVDECLTEWSSDSRAEIRAIVTRAFNVDQAGKINRAELLSLLRLDITDERWLRAMKAIRESQRPIGTKEYVRFYRRPTIEAGWQAVTIDLAAA